jgi:rfaE bifunctional protein nucleotidyltransferase chain/domain
MARDPQSKIMTLPAAAEWRETCRKRGLRLAITNGVFDLLHRGHAQYLFAASRCADVLLVAVNSDASVRAVKGPDRPVIGEQDRAYLVAALEAVDAVVVFPAPKPLDVFERLRPDVYVKGGDYDETTIDREEHALLKRIGVEFRFIPFVQGRSTTSTIRKVKDKPGY